MDRKLNRPTRAASLAAISVSIISIQMGASLAKTVFPVLGAPGTATIRIGMAALVLLLFSRPSVKRLSRAGIQAIVRYGACLGIMNFLFYLSLVRLPLGIAVAVEFTGPLALALLSSRKPIDLLWAFLAALGIFLLSPLTGQTSALDPLGILYAFLAGVCWAGYIVFGQSLSNLVDNKTATTLGMVVAGIVVIPFGLYDAGARLFNLSLFPSALALGVFSSALPYSLEMFALRGLSRKTFGILMSIEPAAAAAFGWMLLGEHLTGKQWLAIACVVVASVGEVVVTKQPPPLAVPNE